MSLTSGMHGSDDLHILGDRHGCVHHRLQRVDVVLVLGEGDDRDVDLQRSYVTFVTRAGDTERVELNVGMVGVESDEMEMTTIMVIERVLAGAD